jgi:hypothetical protein
VAAFSSGETRDQVINAMRSRVQQERNSGQWWQDLKDELDADAAQNPAYPKYITALGFTLTEINEEIKPFIYQRAAIDNVANGQATVPAPDNFYSTANKLFGVLPGAR